MNERIKGTAAVRYLAANYPFDDFLAAVAFVEQKLADGSLHWQRDPHISPEQWEEMRAEEGCPEHVGFSYVEVRRVDVQKLCPERQKHAGGRATKFDYEGGLIHLANICLNEARFCNPSKDDLAQAMREWFNKNDTGGGPDNREIRKRVDRFYDKVIDER